MHARLATFEGNDPGKVRDTVDQIKERSQSGPPEGVPAVSFLLLHKPDEGKVVAIALFETEADMRQGDEVLNAMNPPVEDGMGRTSVELYEVAVKIDT